MTPVTLPAPSPALTVHESAAHIRSLAEKAAADVEGDQYWSRWADGISNALGGPVGDFAGLFSPDLAIHVADWLDERASAHVLAGEPIPPLALAIAAATRPCRVITQPDSKERHGTDLHESSRR
ncbi:hypothetical protein ABZ916_39375 [Streptomyces sp. NPDC046853]|uniref:hypothetical protein n=1 Tax=Streptomyces sp. NPDC046853 TaxID=3154920 RepID=UPI003407C36A